MREASYSSSYALADAGYQSVAASTRPPRPAPFTCSLLAHAAVLCWVIFGPSTSRERPKSLYEQVIAPNEKKLVWYSFNDKLPEVSPAGSHAPSRPPRSEIKLRDQTIVATAPAAKPAKQMIWGPVPRVRLEQDLSAPNLIAFQLPYPAPPPDAPKPKLFVPPNAVRPAARSPGLPEAPAIELARNLPSAAPKVRDIDAALAAKPAPKPFAPPPKKKSERTPTPALDSAPQIEVARTEPRGPMLADQIGAALAAKPRPKPFSPPPSSRPATASNAPLEPAPNVQVARGQTRGPALPDQIGAALASKPQPKTFVAPTRRQVSQAPAPFQPAAPVVDARVAVAKGSSTPHSAGGDADIASALAARPRPRAFTAPREQGTQSQSGGANPALPDAPKLYAPVRPTANPLVHGAGGQVLAAKLPPRPIETGPVLAAAMTGGNVSTAIVGLNPSPRLDVPIPQGSRPAQFSAAPEPGAGDGSGEAVETAHISVPGLMIRNGGKAAAPETVRPVMIARAAPTSTEVLRSAVRAAGPAPALETEPERRAPSIVPTVPDPRFAGRRIYTLAVQMPNVTSAYGSWTMWFAERDERMGEAPVIRLPVPLRKVDPKYVPSAVADRVEGRVQFSGIVRMDGRIDELRLVKGVDERLDSSAADALLKWEFEPAHKNGTPIEMDLVVEIPFFLGPHTSR
jgi:TonB family protein